MSGLGDAFESHLRQILDDFLTAIRGIPADDLNTWKPAMAVTGDQEITTFAAMGVHVAGAGEYMTLTAVGGAPDTRDREAEFVATATYDEIAARFDAWLRQLHDLLGRTTEEHLAAPCATRRFADRGWTNAQALLHALDHSALHLGHAQIQRQLWEYEREHSPSHDGPVKMPKGTNRITDKAAGRTNA